jgi:hypothetical protein
MIAYMTEILSGDIFVSYRSTQQIWEMAALFAADNEAFCTYMLDGRVYRNGRTYS